MYQLFYSPGACSMAVHVVLNELGQEVKLIKATIHDAKNEDAELKKVNPRGQVPVLVEDGKPLKEGAAIITYLIDKHNGALLPASGWERAQALHWLMFANSTLHTGYSKAMFLKKHNAPNEIQEKACDNIQSMWDEIESHLEDTKTPFLCGDQITAGDIVVAVIANWGFLPRKFAFGPKTKELLRRVVERPAYQKAIEAEGIEYKAAA